MADQPNLFEGDKPKDAPKTTQTSEELVATLVGEGKKYKTVSELAKAYMEADEFIDTLKSENQQFREKLASSKTVEDVIQRLEAGRTAAPVDKPEDKGTSKEALSADAIAKIVRETVTGLKSQEVKQANLLKADAELRKIYGDKTQEVFNQRADTPEKKAALKLLAEADPSQFLLLFKEGKAPASGAADGSSTRNSAAVGDTNASHRVNDPACKEYWTELRRKEPKKYYSQAEQLRMNRLATADPGKFFGTA